LTVPEEQFPTFINRALSSAQSLTLKLTSAFPSDNGLNFSVNNAALSDKSAPCLQKKETVRLPPLSLYDTFALSEFLTSVRLSRVLSYLKSNTAAQVFFEYFARMDISAL
jgi:hypothetical protein